MGVVNCPVRSRNHAQTACVVLRIPKNYQTKKGINMRYDKIAKIFTETELLLIEDALNAYIKQDIPAELMQDIVTARRWLHQFGKSQH